MKNIQVCSNQQSYSKEKINVGQKTFQNLNAEVSALWTIFKALNSYIFNGECN